MTELFTAYAVQNKRFQNTISFGLISQTNIPIKIEGVWEDLLYCSYEEWQKYLCFNGSKHFRGGKLIAPHITIELLSHELNPFNFTRPGWFNFRLHIPSSLPLKQTMMYSRLQIEKNNLA